MGTFEWDQFATLTFDSRWGEGGPHPDRVLALTIGWLERLFHGPRYYICVERGRYGRTHSHALLGRGSAGAPIDPRALSPAWKFGRDQIRRFDPALGATHYVAKYLTKSPDHWAISEGVEQLGIDLS